MKETLSAKLVKTLQKGKGKLSGEAFRRLSRFVDSQRTDGDSFADKSGKPDLYYTAFGWMLAYLLDIRLDSRKTAAYLAQQDAAGLDLIHYAAYARCRMIRLLAGKGKAALARRALFPSGTDLKEWDDPGRLPHRDPRSPYTRFVWLSLLEDSGRRIPDKQAVTESLSRYRLPGGGFMNTPDGLTATTNATAAALAVTGQLTGYRRNEDLLYLRGLQDGSGGFRAAEASPVPDLLSTATALFTLSCYGVKPEYPALDFIEAHWLDSGGFSATLMDDRSDVEYTFYGLLALGATP